MQPLFSHNAVFLLDFLFTISSFILFYSLFQIFLFGYLFICLLSCQPADTHIFTLRWLCLSRSIFSSSLALQSVCILQSILCFCFILSTPIYSNILQYCYLPTCCLFSSCFFLHSFYINLLFVLLYSTFCLRFCSLYATVSAIYSLSVFFLNLLSSSRFFLLQSAPLSLSDSTLPCFGS